MMGGWAEITDIFTLVHFWNERDIFSFLFVL